MRQSTTFKTGVNSLVVRKQELHEIGRISGSAILIGVPESTKQCVRLEKYAIVPDLAAIAIDKLVPRDFHEPAFIYVIIPPDDTAIKWRDEYTRKQRKSDKKGRENPGHETDCMGL